MRMNPLHPSTDATVDPEGLAGFSGWVPIGDGGDATVYRALQESPLERFVAIKVLRVDDETSQRRFFREMQLMARLGVHQHPNIVRILHWGKTTMGRPCIVMDYYEHGSLDRQLATTPQRALPVSDVVRVGVCVADALALAHSEGVVHRDIKPQNVLVSPVRGQYVLSDFGIARLLDQDDTKSDDRFSYRHASPETLDGIRPTPSDDMWSLGATLFHLLDGEPPFTSRDPERPGETGMLAYVRRARTEQPRSLTRPDVPERLSALIAQTLNKNPAARPSALVVRNELLGLLNQLSRGFGPSPAAPVKPSPSLPPAAVPSRSRSASAQPRRALPGWASTDADADRTSRRTPTSGPLMKMGLLGVGIGILVLCAVVALMRVMSTSHGITESPTPPSPPAAQASNEPALIPRNVQIARRPDKVIEVRWDTPTEAPTSYILTTRAKDQPVSDVVNTLGPTVNRYELRTDPNAQSVCVGVVAVAVDGRRGADEACL